MIALNLSHDRVTKNRFRAASIELAARALRDVGMTEAADLVERMAPEAIRRVPRDAAVSIYGYVVKDTDTMARSTRRSGLRYVARRLRLAGLHEEASCHLESAADAILIADVGGSFRRRSARSCRVRP